MDVTKSKMSVYTYRCFQVPPWISGAFKILLSSLQKLLGYAPINYDIITSMYMYVLVHVSQHRAPHT